jgi:hypothetical protein
VLIGEFDFAALSRLSEGCRLQIAHGLLRTLVEPSGRGRHPLVAIRVNE